MTAEAWNTPDSPRLHDERGDEVPDGDANDAPLEPDHERSHVEREEDDRVAEQCARLVERLKDVRVQRLQRLEQTDPGEDLNQRGRPGPFLAKHNGDEVWCHDDEP
jgi:hypothetical protein